MFLVFLMKTNFRRQSPAYRAPPFLQEISDNNGDASKEVDAGDQSE